MTIKQLLVRSSVFYSLKKKETDLEKLELYWVFFNYEVMRFLNVGTTYLLLLFTYKYNLIISKDTDF